MTTVLVRPTEVSKASIGGGMQYQFQGYFCEAGDCTGTLKTPVKYPGTPQAAETKGVVAIDAAINAARVGGDTANPVDNSVLVGCHSLGSYACAQWLRENPDATNVLFVLEGFSDNVLSGITPKPLDVPAGATVVVPIREFDFFAAFPHAPTLGLLSQIGFMIRVHSDQTDVDLFDPRNVAFQKDGVTYIAIPAKNVKPGKWVYDLFGNEAEYEKDDAAYIKRKEKAIYGVSDLFTYDGINIPEGATLVDINDVLPPKPTTQSASEDVASASVAKVAEEPVKKPVFKVLKKESQPAASETISESETPKVDDQKPQESKAADVTTDKESGTDAAAPAKTPKHSHAKKDGEKKRGGLFKKRTRDNDDSSSRTSKETASAAA